MAILNVIFNQLTPPLLSTQQALEDYLQLNNQQIEDIVTKVREKLSKPNRTTSHSMCTPVMYVLAKLVKDSKSYKLLSYKCLVMRYM